MIQVKKINSKRDFTHEIRTVREGLQKIYNTYTHGFIERIYDDGFLYNYPEEGTDRGRSYFQNSRKYIKYADVPLIEKQEGRSMGSGFIKKYYIIFRSNPNDTLFNSNAIHRYSGLKFSDEEERDKIFDAMMDLRKNKYNGNAPPTSEWMVSRKRK